MFQIGQALKGLRLRAFSAPVCSRQFQPVCPGPDPRIKLVAITQSAPERAALREIGAMCGWGIFLAASSSEAVAMLAARHIPLVICDRDLPGENWRAVLKDIAFLPQPVCLLLATRVADERLWMEVLEHHGYDVIEKPLRPEQVERAVKFAWSWCAKRAMLTDHRNANHLSFAQHA